MPTTLGIHGEIINTDKKDPIIRATSIEAAHENAQRH
jgi:hypothetical protein